MISSRATSQHLFSVFIKLKSNEHTCDLSMSINLFGYFSALNFELIIRSNYPFLFPLTKDVPNLHLLLSIFPLVSY